MIFIAFCGHGNRLGNPQTPFYSQLWDQHFLYKWNGISQISHTRSSQQGLVGCVDFTTCSTITFLALSQSNELRKPEQLKLLQPREMRNLMYGPTVKSFLHSSYIIEVARAISYLHFINEGLLAQLKSDRIVGRPKRLRSFTLR
jgi:hypothetical protein